MQRAPVKAIVLRQPYLGATRGEVFLDLREYELFEAWENHVVHITKARHLARAARAEAERVHPDWRIDGPVEVYDYNPTTADEEDLALRRRVELSLSANPLTGNILLHGHRRTPDSETIVETFFVLVTAWEPGATRIDAEQLMMSSDELSGVGHRALLAQSTPRNWQVTLTDSSPDCPGRTRIYTREQRQALLNVPAEPVDGPRLRFVELDVVALEPDIPILVRHGGMRQFIRAVAGSLNLTGSVQRTRDRWMHLIVEGEEQEIESFLLDVEQWHDFGVVGQKTIRADFTVARRLFASFDILDDSLQAMFVNTGRNPTEERGTHGQPAVEQATYDLAFANDVDMWEAMYRPQ